MTDTPFPGMPKIQPVPVLWIATPVLVSVLVLLTSLCGILQPSTYAREVPSWAIQAIGRDYANLAVVFLLLASTWYVGKQSLHGYIVWLGAWLYFVYAFAIYSFALHFQYLFLAYVAILGLSGYTLAGGLLAVDRELIAQAQKKNTNMKYAAVLLFAIGMLFGVLWLLSIIPSLLAGTVPRTLQRCSCL